MKKKIFLLIVMLVVLAGLGVGGYFFLNRAATKNFTAIEEDWINDNKNSVIDIYMPRDIMGLTHMGKGVFFDFKNSLEKDVGLTFNSVAYGLTDDINESKYAIELVDKVSDNQIFILRDNYIILGRNNVMYTELESLHDLNIGILESDKEKLEKYFKNISIAFTTFSTVEDLELEFEKEDSTLDALVGLKSLYLDDILTKDYHVLYQIEEMTKDYVLTLKGEDVLNGIIEKYFNRWQAKNLELSYNNNLLEAFYENKGVTEKEKTTLREKAYIYAFNENGAYDMEKNGKLNGINYQIIKSFAEFANVDMQYEKSYNSKEELINDFNEGKIDFTFGNNNLDITIDYYDTVNPISSDIVILTHVNNSLPIHSIYSLTGKKVSVVRGTKIENYLQQEGIEVESYDSLKELLEKKESYSILAIELENYEYYKTKDLSHFKMDYLFPLPSNYGYIVNGDNELFASLFNFYLEYMPIQDIIHKGYQTIFAIEDTRAYYWTAIIVLGIVALVQFLYNAKRALASFKKKHKKTFTKNEKLRYIDSLTSLKNRAYLNDIMEKWDNSEVYPQMIVIVDLNNIAYINDNFGHEEGDKVITEAANILIKTQLPRTEIIRTDGNEFLIYLVEYEEKEVNSYIKKLSKDFKELSHGFGAAIGLSIINDALKTIDDAINEATIDMRSNKENMNSEEK